MASAPLFAVGDCVAPLRVVVDPITRLVVAQLFAKGLPDGVDATGRRSDLALVLDPLPTVQTSFTTTTWDASSSSVKSVTQTAYVYSVRVWDIDAQAFVVAQYPETGLAFARDTQTQGSARHFDADRLDEDVAAIAAAYEAGGSV